MLALADIADNLHRSEGGIWVSRRRQTLSYPDDARSWLFGLEEESWWFRHRNALICAAVEGFPPEGEIIDVGGGNGVVSVALQRAGFPAVLLEPGAEGARNARERGLQRVICSTLPEAGFHAGVLPAVGLFDVIEHIEDDVGFLREIGRCVAAEGRIYATVPAHAWLWSPEDDYAGHHRRYSEASLREALAQAGLSVEYLTFIFALLPLPMLLFRRAGNRSARHRVEGHLTVESRLAKSLLGVAERLESRRVEVRKRIPFGASILAVAGGRLIHAAAPGFTPGTRSRPRSRLPAPHPSGMGRAEVEPASR